MHAGVVASLARQGLEFEQGSHARSEDMGLVRNRRLQE